MRAGCLLSPGVLARVLVVRNSGLLAMPTLALERVLVTHSLPLGLKPTLLAAETSPAPTAIAPLLDALSAGRVDLRASEKWVGGNSSHTAMPVLVHVRKAGGTSLRGYLQTHWSRTHRTHAHIEFGMLPLSCLRLPGLLFILVMRHPIERHVSEFNYAGPGYNNGSACGDVAAYREWVRTESPSGAFERGRYFSNYLVRALTGLCRGVIRCPANEPGCQSGAQVPLDCSTAHPTWLAQLHGQAPWPDEYESEPFGGGCRSPASHQSARSHWRQQLARQVLDGFDVILTRDTLNSSTGILWHALGRSPAMDGQKVDSDNSAGSAPGDCERSVPTEVRALLEDDNAADLALYEYALTKGAPCTRVAGGMAGGHGPSMVLPARMCLMTPAPARTIP